MGIRTTLTLDEDLMVRLKEESRAKGVPFKKILNDTLRKGLLAKSSSSRKPFKIEAFHLGTYPGLNYDNIGELIEFAEGPFHR